MSRFLELWVFGAGLLGALIAQLQISVFIHMSDFLIFTSCYALLLIGQHQPATPQPGKDSQSVTFARPTKPILMLVALTLSAMLLERAVIDWSVIFMRDIFATSPFISGLALALVAFSQFIVRFFADDFVEQYGPEKITYYSVIRLGIGVSLVGFAPSPVVFLAGFSLVGVVTAVIFPLAISAAAQRKDRPAAGNVTALAKLSLVVFLVAPPLLGAVAEFFGIRESFGIGLPLVVLSWLMMRSLRPNA